MNKKTVILISSVLFLFSALFVFANKETIVSSVSFPEGYRQWVHTKSMVIFDKKHPLFEPFGGIHHIYVNEKGLKANQEGGEYPDGSKLVFVLYEADETGGAYVAGKMKFVAVMEKDKKRFSDTGGWGFEVFKAGSQAGAVKDSKKECFECHSAQKSSDYVFSRYVE